MVVLNVAHLVDVARMMNIAPRFLQVLLQLVINAIMLGVGMFAVIQKSTTVMMMENVLFRRIFVLVANKFVERVAAALIIRAVITESAHVTKTVSVEMPVVK